MQSILINKLLFRASVILVALTFTVVGAQTQTQIGDKPIQSVKQTTEKPAAVTTLPLPVLGGGTLGRLTKWVGLNGSNTPIPVIGDSIITETSNGNIGIGTATPTSKLTVVGTVETILGGYKFPDGTVQTTAGLASVFHDASLMGNGASTSPLGIAPGGVNISHLANGAVTGLKIANGSVVRSLNGLLDSVNLAAGPNITITPAGNTLTIAASNSLSSVARDATLTGSGTSGSPLGIANSGVGNSQLADNAVTTAKIAPGQVVRTLNGFSDNVTITTGANLIITPISNTLRIAAPDMLTSIAHDGSLTGDGTSLSPLSVVDPTTRQQPVVFKAGIVMDPGINGDSSGLSYTVPQGKRLVIQQLLATSNQKSSTGFIVIDGTTLLPIVFTEQSIGSSASQQVTIYLNAGQRVDFDAFRSNADGFGQFFFFFYGYLVDAP